MSGQTQLKSCLLGLASLLRRDIDAPMRQRATLHLLDWLGCAAAGAKAPAGRAAAPLNDGSPAAEAFYWGCLGNILEMDDVDKLAILHPGPSIIPAALAECGTDPGKLDRLLDAIIIGYEATIRLGRATGPGHYALWHTTGTCGAIGAAAACSHILDLTEEETAHALALAMSQASGLWQTRHERDSMGKQLHTAHAAQAGLMSARLAASGFKGPLTILEGEQGFFAACAPGANAEDVLRDYPSRWLIADVSFKPWPACRHAHATIDAALIVRDSLPDIHQIQTIRVSTYPDALKFCDRPTPASTIEAKFSLQHCVAVVLSKGIPELADFEGEQISAPAISALREKVQVAAGDPYTSNYPARYGAGLEVDLNDGRKLSAAAPDALGDPENPLTADQIQAKAETLMAYAGVNTSHTASLLAGYARPDADFVHLVREVLA